MSPRVEEGKDKVAVLPLSPSFASLRLLRSSKEMGSNTNKNGKKQGKKVRRSPSSLSISVRRSAKLYSPLLSIGELLMNPLTRRVFLLALVRASRE
jgi:hypothetical protein